jgi:hypothetical protein
MAKSRRVPTQRRAIRTPPDPRRSSRSPKLVVWTTGMNGARRNRRSGPITPPHRHRLNRRARTGSRLGAQVDCALADAGSLASYLPARRAVAVDPVETMRGGMNRRGPSPTKTSLGPSAFAWLASPKLTLRRKVG